MSIKRSMFLRPHPIERDGARIVDPVRDWGAPWEGEWGYRIKRVTNSTDYRPGFLLTKAMVDKLIADGWTVSISSKS